MFCEDCDVRKTKKLIKLENRWSKFKRLRSHPKDFHIKNKDFLTMIQREEMLDQVFSIIFDEDE